jgi:chorismate synthase
MLAAIEAARDAGDSLGGVIECSAHGIPAGWGGPIYDKIEARLASAMLSINATKGFEIGSGFQGTAMRGSEHNDAFYTDSDGRVRTRTNRSGGVQGGITNGEEVWFRVAFKPTSTIRLEQETVTVSGEAATLSSTGRHDPCVVPRAVPIVEAMCLVTLADFWLLSKGDRIG